MYIYIHGKNVDITDAMHDAVEAKLQFLEKYFDVDDTFRANVVVDVYPEGVQVEITITSKVGILRAEVLHQDFYAAVDKAIDKLESQIRKHKTRISKKSSEGLSEAFLKMIQEEEKSEEPELVRTKAIFAQKMNLNDAIVDMEMLGHTFFIYTDDETNEVAVVYKRNDGDYGLLEVEKDV
ncbi:MAG TPA: ribosome-associated translation inhibitor RaiA [Erysipelothrix sp.]